MAVYYSYNALALRLSKPSRKPNPPEKTNQIRSDTGQPNYSSGRWQVFPTRNQFQRVDFGFPPPKPDKLEPTNKNPDSSEKPIFRQKFSKSRRKNPDSSDISHRSSKILTESSEISSNLMRHLLDLGFSRRFLRYMTLADSSTALWRSYLPNPTTLMIGSEWDFLPPDSVGSVLSWAQTRPRPTHGQP